MQLHDLPGDGQPQPGAAGAAGAGTVQPEELLKNAVQLFRRYGRPGVGKTQHDSVGLCPGRHLDHGAGVAVMAGVAQKVIQHTGHFVRVAVVYQLGRQVGAAGQVLRGQHGAKFADHLLKHAGQVGGAALQLDVREVETGDIEEFVDQILQPLGLVQRDAGIPRPKFRRDLRFILQKGQITDHTGQRGL